MRPSYQVLSGLAKVFATHARPWEQLLDDAATIIGEGAGETCVIGVRVGASAVFAPVGVHHQERIQEALPSDLPGMVPGVVPGVVWPVSHRAELVMASGRPYLGGGAANDAADRDADPSAPWRAGLRDSGRGPHMMVAIRFAGVGVGVVVLARERPGQAYTKADAQDLEGPVDVLAVAIRELAIREIVIRPGDGTVTEAPAPMTSSNVATLNGREREVIVLLAEGLTTAEIGETMFLSARTVEWYRARILRKLDRPTRAELVALGRSFSSSL